MNIVAILGGIAAVLAALGGLGAIISARANKDSVVLHQFEAINSTRSSLIDELQEARANDRADFEEQIGICKGRLDRCEARLDRCEQEKTELREDNRVLLAEIEELAREQDR